MPLEKLIQSTLHVGDIDLMKKGLRPGKEVTIGGTKYVGDIDLMKKGLRLRECAQDMLRLKVLETLT